jgi:hypothetical protein
MGTDCLIGRLIFGQDAYWEGAKSVAAAVPASEQARGSAIGYPMLMERRPRLLGRAAQRGKKHRQRQARGEESRGT